MNPIVGLITENTGALVCFWTLLCVWLGFRMGRQVVIPGVEPPARQPAAHTKQVEIDRTLDDPWEAAMSDIDPEERITGDMQ